MDVKCKKCECKFNKCCCCTAKQIKVGKKVDCETYCYQEKKNDELRNLTNRNLFEIGGEQNPHEANKNVKIFCDAKCLFNCDGMCYANGITVLESKGDGKTPCCATQITK